MFVFLFNVGYVGAASVVSPNVLPSNVLYYVPITVTANGPVVANAQVMFTFLKNNYLSYESHNLQNIEFFYSNGTIIPSWLEGESLSPSLSSLSVSYWLKIVNPNFLPSTGSTNTVYMGFGSTSTNFFNGNTVGESPILSSSYGEYDNGANVFSYYQSFGGLSGNSLPTGWTSVNNETGQTSGLALNTIVVNNHSDTVIYVAGNQNGCGCGIFTNALPSMSPGNTIEWYGNIFNNQSAGTFAGLESIPSGYPVPLYTWNYETGYEVQKQNIVPFSLGEYVTTSNTPGILSTGPYLDGGQLTSFTDSNTNKIYGIQINSATSFNALVNYISYGQDTSESLGSPSLFVFSVGLNPTGVVHSSPQSIYWLRTRTNTQMPTLSFGSVYPSPMEANIVESPTLVYDGSTISLNATVSGGVSPYTYNFIIYNATSGNVLINTPTGQNNNTLANPIKISNTGNYLAQVEVTDSSYPANQVVYSANVPFNAIPFNGIVITTNTPIIDFGQTVYLTVNDINPLNNGKNNNFDLFINGNNINSGASYSNFPISNTVVPTTTGNIVYTAHGIMVSPFEYPTFSNSVVVTVNPALSISAANSGSSITTGSSETLTATVSGGTQPYSYQWYSISGSSNTIISGATSSTYTPSTSRAGSFTFGVNVIDAANAVAYSNPISFTVTSPPTTTVTGPSNTGFNPAGGSASTVVTSTPAQLPPSTTPPTTTPKTNVNTQPSNTLNTNTTNKTKTSTNALNTTNKTKNVTPVVTTTVAKVVNNTGFPWWIILLIIIIIVLLLLYWYMRKKKHAKHHSAKHNS